MPAVQLPPDLEHRYLDVNGIRMHVATCGTGEPVLFLHGFPEFWYSWRHQIAALAPHYRVIVPDQRGYNETEARGPYDIDNLQADMLALLSLLGETSAHVVGHDWGGAVAWALASYHPGSVRSLAALNVPHPARFLAHVRKSPKQALRSWYMAFFQVPWLPEKALAGQDYQYLARSIIRECAGGTFTRDDIRQYLAAWRRQGLGGGINWYRTLPRTPRPEPGSLPPYDGPALLVWGTADRFLGIELSEGNEEFAPRLRVERLEGVSHWVQQEEPGEVNRMLLDHLRLASGDAA
jgi:pimeloyl-ACP methyl ester carboxylesterase